jgi:hypothetical protein
MVLAAHAVRHCAARCGAEPPDGSCGARVLKRVLGSARTVMFVRVEPMTLTWPVELVEELPEIPTSPPPPPSACTPHAAQSSRRRPPKG